VKPEEAVAAARAAAEPFDEGPVSLDASPLDTASAGRLAEWAVIQPQMDRVYSDRRGGRALGAAKRLLVRALRQYFAEIIAQENRYNALATAHIVRLEERVRELEAELKGSGPRI
jgi:hypothetical protein